MKRKYGLSEKVKDDKQVKTLPPLVKAQVERDIAMIIKDHKKRSNNKFGIEQTVLDQVKNIAIKFYSVDKEKWYEETPELLKQYIYYITLVHAMKTDNSLIIKYFTILIFFILCFKT